MAAATPAAAPADSTLPGPGIFRGRPGDRGMDWLEKFELWSRCRSYSDEVKMAAFQLQLEDGAAIWMQVLPDGDRGTWNRLRAAFIARYGPNQQTSWQKASELWKLQQAPDEAVLDFIDRALRVAREGNVAADMTIGAIINGMRPSLRSHVLRLNPTDMTALRAGARTAEMTEVSSPDNNGDAIRRIEEQLQQLTMHTMASSCSRGRSPDHDPERRRYPSRSPSWNRSSRFVASNLPSYDRRPPFLREPRQPENQRPDYHRMPPPSTTAEQQYNPRRLSDDAYLRNQPSRSPLADRRVSFADAPGGRSGPTYPLVSAADEIIIREADVTSDKPSAPDVTGSVT